VACEAVSLKHWHAWRRSVRQVAPAWDEEVQVGYDDITGALLGGSYQDSRGAAIPFLSQGYVGRFTIRSTPDEGKCAAMRGKVKSVQVLARLLSRQVGQSRTSAKLRTNGHRPRLWRPLPPVGQRTG